MKLLKKIAGMISMAEDAVVLLLCLAMFLAGGYGLYDSWMVYRQAGDDSILKYRPDYTGDLPEKEIQGRMVAWLTLDGTEIDYPVMQGADNFEYLNKNPYGEYALSGSIFLDCRNREDFSDSYSLIYGHHMENDYMFGALDHYLDPAYLEKHRKGSLTVGKTLWSFTVEEVLEISAREKSVFEPMGEENLQMIKKLQEKQENAGKELHWLALSTCRYPDTADRIVLLGILEKRLLPEMS